MAPVNSRTNLVFHLRSAIEQWLDEYVSNGPYEDLIHELATVVDAGELSLTAAARIDALLRATTGKEQDKCGVCECPLPGLSHPPSGGCPDVRLHELTPDKKCRYCRGD